MTPDRHDVNETPEDRIRREEEAEKRADAKAVTVAKTSRKRWRRDLIVFGSLIVLLFSAERAFDKTQRAANRDAILDGLQANCNDDRRFRSQYRVRGIAEKQLLELFLGLAAEDVKEGGPDAAASQQFIIQFKPLTDRIEVLPVPDCGEERETIEESLE